MAKRRTSTEDQLEMFSSPADRESFARRESREATEATPHLLEGERELAAELPPWVRLGTSSWTFPGWGGVFYEGSPSMATLVKTGLRAYAAHPLFRTVGIDRSHYSPLTVPDLEGYARELPEGFLAISKVWDEITTFVYPRHPRFGARGGETNPGFLDPVRTADAVFEPYLAAFANHAGPFVFEIPPIPAPAMPSPELLSRAIDRLLSHLRGRFGDAFRVSFELRNRELLTPRYLDTLRAHGAGHVLNFWTGMPTVGEQLTIPGVITAPFVVSRLMIPPYARYEEKKVEFAPFDRIVAPQPAMREDVVTLARAAEALGVKEMFVVVNNKAEGSSPFTVLALARALVSGLRAHAPRQP